MIRQKLYRRMMACATGVAMLLSNGALAQSPAKKRSGPRAIAVVQWQADAKDKAVPVLVPVAILDEGRYFDAGLYKAAPAPMPLLYGFVYEAQDEGELLGYFTIKYQTRTERTRSWVAIGDWKSVAPHVYNKIDSRPSSAEIVRDKSDVPTGATPGDSGDDRDLKKKSTTVYDENGQEVKPGDNSSADAKAGEKADRPKLKRGQDAASDAKGSKTDEAKKPQAEDPDRPTIKRQKNASTSGAEAEKPAPDKTATAGKPAANDAKAVNVPEKKSAEDPDRPQLRRGKPTTTAKADLDPDRPVIRHSSAKAIAEKEGTIPVPPRVLARGPRLINPARDAVPVLQVARVFETVAVSDASVDEPQSFRYKMAADERDALTIKMTALAQGESDAFLKSTGRTVAAEKPSVAKTVKGKSAARKIPDEQAAGRFQFAESHVEILDLAHSNDPLLIFSGRERVTTAQGANKDVYVTYVAKLDLDGNPRKRFISVTSSDRLDVTPMMELIDAVDADGDGKAELLFRRSSGDAAEFAIYRVTIDGLTEIFHGGVAD
jgi:hypothetical protein